MSFSNEDDHHIENIKKATDFDKYTVLIRHCMTATWKCLTSCVMEEINKQQRFFLSEYHLQEINSREIYPHSTFSLKRNKCAKVWKKCKFIFRVRTESWILEKVLKFAQQFSRPGKSLVNGDKEKSIFLLFLGPLLVTYFDNLESGKKTVLLEKSLDFWIQKPVYKPWF